MWFLFLVYVFNFVDRQILTTLIEPIKNEFGLHDWQLGALSGTAFALFYTTFGIPIARWADKSNRVNIIALSLLIWSSATAVTAFARNFWQLFAARVVVGIGESGCSPPALSVISDYFEPKRRSKALSIYAMGVYGGTFIGLMMGGVVAQIYGWRAAFFIVGVPGILLAVILKLTIREPPRGFSEGGAHTVKEAPPMMLVVKTLVSKRSFRHLALASGLHAFVSYGVSAFYNSYLIRSHGFTVAEAGVWLAFIVGIGGLLGTYVGGTYADKLTQRHSDSRYHVEGAGHLESHLAAVRRGRVHAVVHAGRARLPVLVYLLRHDVPGAVDLGDVSPGGAARARAGDRTAVPGTEFHRHRDRADPDRASSATRSATTWWTQASRRRKRAPTACATRFRSSYSRSRGRRSTTTARCARCVRKSCRPERTGRVARA